ncbi:MAG: 50S ribosomal protein L6 [Comamonas sp. SCN 67-35]|uniref:50S ribosomal protein L6 n=1 Tax=unclassified Comamonas TaxID=2638500 RepID=UPI000868AC96|nr:MULTISPECIES: 50S ribosomal protein L6 [unclassified Comamonas]MBN9330745.1 50S ribosomal protein L6 [Comamonas sp.]ODU39982.1 MAG: 50S ribosomal protein L6 [Comamonas sp. SCN 67-35]OJW98044.1 MAG: 50S ribosomal protein L6 [Burkholderiales bacterium 66-26]
MSRVAKAHVIIPSGVDVSITAEHIQVKGAGGTLSVPQNPRVKVANDAGRLSFEPVDESREANALSGTVRQLVNNMVVGVGKGFEKKLSLIGVGFKAAASGNKLNLNVGYSHPVDFVMPAGVSVACPTPTEIVIKGADRQVVGQLAAEIRAVRPPEPYKGKGIRYADETVVIKETKKK